MNTIPTYQSGKTSVAPEGSHSPDAVRAAAMQFLSELAAELSGGTVDLPCFPNIVLRIRTALADPMNTPEKTVKIVGTEPRLAARLLQTANSAAFNPYGRPLTELRTAITRLGHQLVQSAAMAFAVQHMKDEALLKTIAAPLNELWKESVAVAAIAQLVARRTKVTPDEAFLTGLLHGIGRLYIMVRAIGKESNFGDRESFNELVSSWQASIGKAVLENWGFADHMCEAIADQRDYERPLSERADITDVLIVSALLSDALKMPEPRSIDIEGIAPFTSVGLSPNDCADLLKKAVEQISALQSALGV